MSITRENQNRFNLGELSKRTIKIKLEAILTRILKIRVNKMGELIS